MDNKDIQDKLDHARTAVTENVQRATSTLKESAERLGESAREAGASASEKMEKAKEQASKAAGQTNRILTEHPLAAAAAAVAIGATLAYMFPLTRRTSRAATSRLLTAASAVGQKARQALADQAKATPSQPVQESGHLLEKIGDAARKAPTNMAEAARSGMESARSGLESARSFAAETARKAELDEKAGKLLDAASEVASKLASRMRDHSRRDEGQS